ncbi:MAG: tRNA (N(6)-L-threonylcarbamoyladenosine(37)-C(2))-methylthiotransferase MtaB [Alphaproteobacteria bacterium]|nr:tRNA (N(6)-L-threonylcarbamoyladenosine(37)-C(2))-methylthiotransferase MtaB [Alphaproteobacteria bacterium]
MSNEVITFGCRVNIFESEVIKKCAEEAGLNGAVIVNTCAVTGEAVRQARQNIRKIRKDNPEAMIVVAGCAAQLEPHKFADMPEVDFVLGNIEKLDAKIFSSVNESYKQGKSDEKVIVSDIMEVAKIDTPEIIDGFEGFSKAFIQVQQGCDHRCTYCIVPYVRGHNRSVRAEDVIIQVQKLISNGYKEVILSGVDVTSYGMDDGELNASGNPVSKLGDLVEQILTEVPELKRLRFGSLDPMGIDEKLLEIMCNEERVLPHFHLSLQSGDNMILKRMARRHLRDDVIKLCNQIRNARPDVAFGADIIAGFPTETDEMFENSLKIVDECGFTHLHVFPYSVRNGTPAAKMVQVKGDVAKERAKKLREKGEAALSEYMNTKMNTECSVMVEKRENDYCVGFSEHYLKVKIHCSDCDDMIGNVISVKITDVKDDYLLGELK